MDGEGWSAGLGEKIKASTRHSRERRVSLVGESEVMEFGSSR